MSTAWDALVGIDLTDWMRADTPEQIAWLAWLRDHPMPAPEPPPCCCDLIKIVTINSGIARTVRGWPDPECPRHRRQQHQP